MNKAVLIFGFSLIGCWILSGCKNELKQSTKQFYQVSSNVSNVDFVNKLSFDQKFNIYKYRNFYNGGGVGIGDVNNDGWMDLYFTSNMGPNKLYLNKGEGAKKIQGLEFEDISKSSGASGTRSWSTGVAMVDINGDNKVDIYVCNSGDVAGDNKQNELFVNQGNNTFLDEAEKYGLADTGLSTHAAFFDYDHDGDLDCYLLNNSFQAIGSFNLKKNERPIRNAEGGDKLYRNDDGLFVDVSEEAGIYGSVIGFGLGVTIGDINLDGWQDIFVSNDFFERDYIYMNNGDGTFTENLEQQMKSITGASMGADMADINNDGYPELFVTDMLPEPNDRLKTKTTFENWDRYKYNLDNGYYHQFTRNMLHLNNGDGTFSEIGRMLGVEATDWSWGALINDFDNDGLKDLFIANGILKDLTDQDYIKYISTREMAESVISADGVDFKRLTDVMPSNKISNYMYRNKGGLVFENSTEEWGLSEPSHSNGSAYADFDNDGDLDLVINNLNEVASLYVNQNEITKPDHHYLKFRLKGSDKNTQAVGARVVAYQSGIMASYEVMPAKGFQSSVDPRPNLGFLDEVVDSIRIFWPRGKETFLTNISTDQILDIDEKLAQNITKHKKEKDEPVHIFTEITSSSRIDFIHSENDFVDFDRDRLIYHMLSTEGPALCTGDFNGDNREDFYIGGAKDQQGVVYIQQRNGKFSKANSTVFGSDKISEDVDCTCFDADGDNDIDIYVASGGNEFPNSSSALIDRLYINNGKGHFTRSDQILPSLQFENSSCVAPSDIDQDGDLDLFVGIRAKPFLLGVPVDGHILENDGTGYFSNVTVSVAPELKKIGMITDGIWSDIDMDNDDDLVVVGEWMGIRVFENNDGKLSDVSSSWGLDSTNGWWNVIQTADIDQDGDPDFIIGNHGLNSRFKTSRQRPVQMYVNDFDQNGSAEPIICAYFDDVSYPLALKHDLVTQMPILHKKYVAYESYKDQRIENIFSPEQLQSSIKSEVYLLESVVLMNNGEAGFEIVLLPKEAQLSPVYAIAIDYFDHDDLLDIVLGGNFYNAKPEVGRYDASYGVFLKGAAQGKFEYLPNKSTGLTLDGQIRSFAIMPGNKNLLLSARNDAPMLVHRYE